MSKELTVEILDEKLNDFSVKLLKYLDKRFDDVNQRIDALDEKYVHLMVTLDAFLKRLDDIEKDNYARDHEIERLKRWIEQIAKQTGVQLEY